MTRDILQPIKEVRAASRVVRLPRSATRGVPRLTLAAAFARQHLVHHLAAEPEIGGRVAHLLELRAREMAGDIGILRQQINQWFPARRHLAANVVDEVVRALTAEM